MPAERSTQQKIQQFLQDKQLYQLGMLTTEQGHPDTKNLSEWASGDLKQGLQALRQVDILSLEKLKICSQQIFEMTQKVRSTLNSGHRVFLGGCGATGRLSIVLERIFRETFPDKTEQVVGFMAGGDVAFVHAIEGFEDFPDYGARQLMELGFKKDDLFLGITEGGETPFVIGATEKAAEVSHQPVYFLFCNPENILKKHVARSRRVLENPSVKSVCLESGPMALAGSTRMQASTVLMIAAGAGLMRNWTTAGELEDFIEELRSSLNSICLDELKKFIELEADCYQNGDKTIYRADEFSASVFTDTTERAPTFSLASFDNQLSPQRVHSLTYVTIPETHTPEEAWERLFLRSPRTLEWSAEFIKTRADYMRGFDFSERAREYRESLIPDHQHFVFSIEKTEKGVLFSFRNHQVFFEMPDDIFVRNLLLKMILNMHSTLVMGRIGRYESHFMTYVSPSNGKLVDRAVRYTRSLLEWRGQPVPAYDDVVETLLSFQAEIPVNESVVLKTVEHYLATSTA